MIAFQDWLQNSSAARVLVANAIAVLALKAATSTIPIVFATGFDPVRTGLVASLSTQSTPTTRRLATRHVLPAS